MFIDAGNLLQKSLGMTAFTIGREATLNGCSGARVRVYRFDNRCSVHPPESNACAIQSIREKFLFRATVSLAWETAAPCIVSGNHNHELDEILIEVRVRPGKRELFDGQQRTGGCLQFSVTFCKILLKEMYYMF